MHGKFPALIDVTEREYHLKNIRSIDGNVKIRKDSEGRSVIIAEEERLMCRCLQAYLVKIPKRLVVKHGNELVLQGYRITTEGSKELKRPTIHFNSEMGKYYIGRITIAVKQRVQFRSINDDSFLPIRCELYLNGFPSKIFAWLEFEARKRDAIDTWHSKDFKAICPVNVASDVFEEITLMQSDRSTKRRKSKVKDRRKKKSTGTCKHRKRPLSEIERNCQNQLDVPDRRRMKKSPVPDTMSFQQQRMQNEDLFQNKRVVATKDGQSFTMKYGYKASNAQEPSHADDVENISNNRQDEDDEIPSSDIGNKYPKFKDCDDYGCVFDEGLLPNPTCEMEGLSLNTLSNATAALDALLEGNDDDTSTNQEIACYGGYM